MTREEAIEWLTDIKENVTENWSQATDVYKAHEEEHLNIMNRIKELQYAIAKTQTIVGKMVESAEVKPTVIRSKTLLPTKDFKEWAKRVRETNPNVIVIPCDAEVVSADAVQGEWIWRTDIPIGDGRTSAGYICSNCGKDYWHGNVFNFCPSCGARMYKDGDEDCDGGGEE